MCEECTVIGIDVGGVSIEATGIISIEATGIIRPDGSLMLVSWKATNHGSEAVTVEPPAALQPPELKP